MASLDEILAQLEKDKKALGGGTPASAVVRRQDILSSAFKGQIAPTPAADKGGWGGLVESIVDSPIGKVATKGLDVLSMGGRAVASGIQEIADTLDTDPKTSASWGDFTKQIGDPTFGFGTVIGDLTGNKWVDRALGFIGDVAIDPLTYVTFGASKFAGQGGRFALARMAEKAGLDGAKVAKVARFGRAALDAEDIQRLGINRAGLYMFGKKLPATNKLGELAEKSLAMARVALSDTKMGRAFQKAFTPLDYKEMRLALARGDVLPEKAATAIKTVTSRDVERQVAARSSTEGQRRVATALAEGGEAELASVRKTLHTVLENPQLLATASPVMQKAYERWTNVFRSFWDDINGGFAKIQGFEGGVGQVQDYFPHMVTDDARKWMDKGLNAYSKEVAEFLDNPLDPVAVFNHRKLKKGSDWFGVKLTADDLTVDRLNELARSGGFVGDFFETDILAVAEKYVKQYADQMGVVARLQDLADGGVIKMLSEKSLEEVVLNPKHIKAQAKVVGGMDDAVASAAIGAKDAVQVAVEAIDTLGRESAQTIASIGAERAARGAATVDALDSLRATTGKLGAAANELDNYRQTLTALVGADGSLPIAVGPVMKKVDEVQARLVGLQARMQQLIDEETALRAKGGIASGERVAARKQVQAEAREAAKKIDSDITGLRDSVSYNQLLTDNYEIAKNGTKFSGKSAFLNDIGQWLGAAPISQAKRGRAPMRARVGGSITDFIQQRFKDSPIFKKVAGDAKVSPSRVATFNTERVEGTVTVLLNDGARGLEDGRAASLWVVARDEMFFDGDIPDVLGGARKELEDTLDGAQQAVLREKAAASAKTVDVADAKKGADLEKVANEIVGNEQSVSQATQRAADVELVAQEAKSYAERLKKFSSIRESLESRGLATSEELISDADKNVLVTVLLDEQQIAERAARATANDVGEDPAARIAAEMNAAEVDDASFTQLSDEMVDESDVTGYGTGGRTEDVKAARKATSEDNDFAAAINSAIKNKIDTYADLHDALRKIETAIGERQWNVGQGVSERVYTVRDAIVAPNSVDGLSNIDRALTRTSAREAERAAVVSGRTAAESAADVAEKLSLYQALSETYQRFVNTVATLGKVGLTPTKEMLSDAASAATASMRQSWRAEVTRLSAQGGPELERAQRVLNALEAFAQNPADDLYARMLTDAEQRLRSAGAALPDNGRLNPLDGSARKAMDDATDALNNAKTDPLYGKALNDRDMVNAMNDLADTDLFNYELPNGVKGFIVEDEAGNADLLMMPDGTPLSFTEAEWRSLYRKTTPEFDEGDKAFDAYLAARDSLDRVNSQIENKAKLLENGRSMIADIERKKSFGKATPDDMTKYAKVRGAMVKVQQEIEDLQSKASRLRATLDVESPEVQAAALEKMRILVHGNGTQPAWYKSGNDISGVLSGNASVVAERRANLKAAWETTEEFKLLSTVDELAARAEKSAQRSFSSSKQAVETHADRLKTAADEAAEAAAKQREFEAAQKAAETVAPAAAPDRSRISAIMDRIEGISAERTAVAGDIKGAERELRSLQKAVESARSRLVKDLGGVTGFDGKIGKATQRVETLRETAIKAQIAYDQAQAVAMSYDEFAESVIPSLERNVAMANSLLEGTTVLPQPRIDGKFGPRPTVTGVPASVRERAAQTAADRAAGTKAAAGRLKKARLTDEEFNALMEWREGAQRALKQFNDDPNSLISKVLVAASDAESALWSTRFDLNREQMILERLQRGDTVEKIKQYTERGFESLEKIGLPGMQAPREVYDMLTNVRRATSGVNKTYAGKLLARYTKFFKAYATLSPGFHVRNAISNTFMIFAAGASPKNAARGLELYTSLMKHIRGQGKIEDWLAKFSGTELERVNTALRAMEAAGGGRVEEAFADFARRGQRLSDNRILRKSRQIGERVEGSARFMLAYDSAVSGMDFSAATARVRRYLFDYMDVGSADERIRAIVPFWMWMSRNLPLQMINQWTNPRAYAIYNNFIKNFGQPEEGEIVPSWLKEQGAVKIADGWYLSLDLGFNRLGETFKMLENPKRLLSDVNPLLRLPVEVGLSNTKFYNDVPFGQKGEQPVGGPLAPAVQALAGLLGQTRELETGGTGVSPKLNYSLMSAIPFIGQAERLAPNTELYSDRQLGSILSYLGIPVRQVTESQREAELRRRTREGEA